MMAPVHVASVYFQGHTQEPKLKLFGQSKSPIPQGRPRRIWIKLIVSEFQQLNAKGSWQDAQNRPAWQARTGPYTPSTCAGMRD